MDPARPRLELEDGPVTRTLTAEAERFVRMSRAAMPLPSVFPYQEAPRDETTSRFRDLCHPMDHLCAPPSPPFGRDAMSHDDEIVRAQVAQALANMERVLARGPERARTFDILTLLYDRKLNSSVASRTNRGWTAKLGDQLTGVLAEAENFATVDGAACWLLEEATRRHPARMAREL